MDTTVILIAIVAFSVVVTTLLPRLTGTAVRIGAVGHFVLGVIVGPQALGLLDVATIDRLHPLLSLLLGILAFGLGLDLRGRAGSLAGVLPRAFSAVVVAAVVAAITYPLTLAITQGAVSQLDLTLFSLSLGAMASASSWRRVEETTANLRAQGTATRALGAFSMTSLVAAVLMFGAVSAAMRSKTVSLGIRELTTLEWLVATVGVGFVCGLLFVTFIGSEKATSRVFLATVGTVIFATGMAAGLGISPLLVNLVVGATVGAFSGHAKNLQQTLDGLHHPTYVLLLILVGALWSPPPALLWLLLPAYVLTRWVGLHMGTRAAAAMAETTLPSRRFGSGLLAQGAFALAIATNYLQLRPEDGSILVTVAIAAILAEDLVADRQLRRVLGDAEELFVAPEAPAAEAPPAQAPVSAEVSP